MADFGVGEGAAVEGAKTAGEAAAAEGGTAVAAEGAGAAAAGGAAESAGVMGATAASGAGAGYAAGTAAGTGAGAGTLTGSALTDVALVEGGTSVATSLLAPKPPKGAPPTAMPDPLAQEQAKRQAIIEQLARRGRASTILTNPGNTLGG